jgi:lactate 2-monooxygenase
MADAEVPFAVYQNQVYAQGLGGVLPPQPFAYHALEERARGVLTPGAYGYIAGGAGNEDTMRANLEAFRHWRLEPRMLRDVARRDLRTSVLGTDMPAPLMLAPVGVQSIAHADAELAVARAARSTGVPMVLSTASSSSIEDVAAANGDGARWFQLYWPRDPDFAISLLQRAERAGYRALVVTLDTSTLGWRPRDLELAYLPFLHGEGTANYTSDPVFRAALAQTPEQDPLAARAHWAAIFANNTLTWDNLGFLREHSRLPIVLKGVLHPDDARRAVDSGVDGVIVSNHGGRQVDGAIAALDALPRVVSALPDTFPVLFDSGIRGGADIVKALALGAKATLIGRMYMWGLAAGGEAGVQQVIQGVLAELDVTMALCGYKSLSELRADILVRA